MEEDFLPLHFSWYRKNKIIKRDGNIKESIMYPNDNSIESIISNISTKQRNTAFREAAYYGHANVVEILMQYNDVDPSLEDNIALRFAANNGYVDIMKLLLRDKRVDISASNYHVIRYSCQLGKLNVVKYLIEECGIGVGTGLCDEKGDSVPLRRAVEYGHTKVAKYLLETCPQIDCTTRDSTCLFFAAKNDDVELVELLLKRGCVIGRDGIAMSRKSAVRILISDGVCGYESSTALKGAYDVYHRTIVDEYKEVKKWNMIRVEVVREMYPYLKDIVGIIYKYLLMWGLRGEPRSGSDEGDKIDCINNKIDLY